MPFDPNLVYSGGNDIRQGRQQGGEALMKALVSMLAGKPDQGAAPAQSAIVNTASQLGGSMAGKTALDDY